MNKLFNLSDDVNVSDIVQQLEYYKNRSKELRIKSQTHSFSEIVKEARIMRQEISDEYRWLYSTKVRKFYRNSKSHIVYLEYSRTISNMNKFTGNLTRDNINGYLCDVIDYATQGIPFYN